MGVLCGSQKKEVPVTHLRNMMLEELQRRNYSQNTTRAYVRVVRELAKHFHQPPDRLGPDHIRQFQAYLFRERKLEPGTVLQYSAGLRFFFIKTLKRHFHGGQHSPAQGAMEVADHRSPIPGTLHTSRRHL